MAESGEKEGPLLTSRASQNTVSHDELSSWRVLGFSPTVFTETQQLSIKQLASPDVPPTHGHDCCDIPNALFPVWELSPLSAVGLNLNQAVEVNLDHSVPRGMSDERGEPASIQSKHCKSHPAEPHPFGLQGPVDLSSQVCIHNKAVRGTGGPSPPLPLEL